MFIGYLTWLFVIFLIGLVIQLLFSFEVLNFEYVPFSTVQIFTLQFIFYFLFQRLFIFVSYDCSNYSSDMPVQQCAPMPSYVPFSVYLLFNSQIFVFHFISVIPQLPIFQLSLI